MTSRRIRGGARERKNRLINFTYFLLEPPPLPKSVGWSDKKKIEVIRVR